jgi:signal transduction histidine kinase
MEPKVSILLVDDDSRKRAALAATLEPLGHDLVTASSSREALQLVLRQDYAVMLLDVQMPGMDGFEFAAIVRSRERSRNIPIIFITAYSRAELDAMEGYSLGAVDFIFSPVMPQVLQAKVRVFIDLALARRKLEDEIAERRRVQEDLAARAAELEAANQDLDSFSYSVSHDLRAPLRAINGFAAALQEEHAGELGDEGRRLLRVVLDQGRMMEGLISGLLEFSRLGRGPIAASRIDMNALAARVIEELQLGGAATIVVHPMPPAWGDHVLLGQVWANLLANAVKFSGMRAQPQVEATGYAAGPNHVYCVRDNGAGFDMQHYDRLFGVFQRLHRAEEFAGNGVGLAIVQRVVARHGGRTWAEGKVDEGAAFYFSLPAAAGASETTAGD